MTSKLISIYGSQGSGKTTLTAQLALALQKHTKKEVLIVGLDSTKPIIPCLLPNSNDIKGLSLGKIFSDEVLNLHTVLKNIYMTKNDIGIIGYNMNENDNTYAQPTQSRIDNFFIEISKIVDYCIIDCTSDIIRNKATSRAIANSDITIQLLSAGINGVVFDSSQTPILLQQEYKFDKFLRYVSITDEFSYDIPTFESSVGRITGILPYSDNAQLFFQQGNLLSKSIKKSYGSTIEQMIDIILKE